MSDPLAMVLRKLCEAAATLGRRSADHKLAISTSHERKIVAAIEHLVFLFNASVSGSEETTPAVCVTCSNRDSCKEPCDRLADILPGEHTGRGRRERLCGLRPNCDTLDYRDSSFDLYRFFINHAHLFTRKQWEVIQPYYRDGRTEAEIARFLRISRSTVSERLSRAKERFKAHLSRQNTNFHGKSPSDPT